MDTAPGAPLVPAPYRPVAPSFDPRDPVPDGYRIRYQYSTKELIAGGSILAFSFTVTTLIASGIAAAGIPGVLFAPMGGIPVVGSYPLAALSALTGVGPGTVGALIGFGVLQDVGFAILIHGLATRKPIGLERDCTKDHGSTWTLSPLAMPGGAGLSVGGAL